MDIIAMIAARGGSKGVPGKNTKMLKGKPLIQWTIDAAIEAVGAENVFVSSEDIHILGSVSQTVGTLTRPKFLAEDDVQTDEVHRYALRQLFARLNEQDEIEVYPRPDTLVILDPTCPFREARHIKDAISLYQRYRIANPDKPGSIFCGCLEKRFLWRQTFEGAMVDPIGHDPLQRLGRQYRNDWDWPIRECGAMYVTDIPRFLALGNYRLAPQRCYLLPAERCIEIDEPADWDAAVAAAERLLP